MRELVRPVVTLLSGSVLAQAIIYAARPVLTRLFTPEEFGAFSFYLAVVAVLASISTGKFDDAVVLPSDHRDGWSLVGVSLLVTVVVALTVTALLPARSWLAGLMENPEAAVYLVWLPVSLLLVGTIRVFDSWLTRLKVFSGVATGRVGYAAGSAPTQITAGSMGAGAGGLIGGIIAGQAVQAVLLAARGLLSQRSLGPFRWDGGGVRTMARRYRRFAIFGAPASALNVASVQTPALLLLFFFDSAVLGQYSVAYASLGVPLTLLGAAVSQVYYVNATDAVRTGALPQITEAVLVRLGAVGILPLASILIVGPDVFAFVFGETWRTAGHYAQLIAPWIFFLLLSGPLARLFDVFEKQRELLVYNAVLLVTRISAIVAGGLAASDLLAVGLFGATGAVLAVAQIIWMIRLSGWSLRAAVAGIFRFAPLAIPFLLVLWLSVWTGLGSGVVTAITVGAAVVYGFVLHRRDPTLFSFRSRGKSYPRS